MPLPLTLGKEGTGTTHLLTHSGNSATMVLNPEFPNFITMAATKLLGTHAEEACWPKIKFQKASRRHKTKNVVFTVQEDDSQKCFDPPQS